MKLSNVFIVMVQLYKIFKKKSTKITLQIKILNPKQSLREEQTI